MRMFTFKKYRATKKNVLLLESAMKALGYEGGLLKVSATTDYQDFKERRWFYAFHNDINEKMQELENQI